MTDTEFTGADLDRLADYVAGALDPAESAQVANLIATQPGWASAFQAVVAADERVRAQLRDHAEEHPEFVPPDVAARFAQSWAPLARTTVVSLDDARRRRRRWTTLTTAAAALVVLAGGAGVVASLTNGESRTDTTASGAVAPEAVDEQDVGGKAEGATEGPLILASGVDYRLDTLNLLARRQLDTAAPPSLDATAGVAGIPQAGNTQAAGSLQRLSQPAELAACLRAVTAEHPGIVVAVDFATFIGNPALVILVTGGSSGLDAQTAVVAGPACGLDGSDELASSRLS